MKISKAGERQPERIREIVPGAHTRREECIFPQTGLEILIHWIMLDRIY